MNFWPTSRGTLRLQLLIACIDQVQFRSIKLYAWEFSFIRNILAVRNDEELKMLKKIGVITVTTDQYSTLHLRSHLRFSVNQCYNVERHPMWVVSLLSRLFVIDYFEAIVSFCAFLTAALFSGKPLTSDVIFPAMTVFRLLNFPLSMVNLC